MLRKILVLPYCLGVERHFTVPGISTWNIYFGGRHRGSSPLFTNHITQETAKMKSIPCPDQRQWPKQKIVGLDVSQIKPASWCLKVSFTVICTGCKEKKSHSRHSLPGKWGSIWITRYIFYYLLPWIQWSVELFHSLAVRVWRTDSL